MLGLQFQAQLSLNVDETAYVRMFSQLKISNKNVIATVMRDKHAYPNISLKK